jgi:hypothetical protein
MKNTLINFKSLLLSTCLMLTVQSSNAQIQKGADIDGEADGSIQGKTPYEVLKCKLNI